jgi:G3E family GTPase
VSSSIEAAVITPAPVTGPGAGRGAIAQLVELPNGCICCAASDDLVDALTRLLRSPDGPRLDHIIVEASGLADPGPVAAAFWLDEQLETRLRLNAIVTVVDANMLPMYLGLPRPWEQVGPAGQQQSPSDNNAGGVSEKASLAEKQIAVADAILLNKVDLMHDQPEALHAVRSAVRSLKATPSFVVETVQCSVPLEKLLTINAYDPSRCADLASSELYIGKPVHPRGVGSVSFAIPHAQFDSSKLDRAYGKLLWEDRIKPGQGEIWRAKALVAIRGEERKVLYQAVHTLFEGERSHVVWGEGEPRASSFVFIGRGLVKTHLQDVIMEAVANDE